MRLLITSLLLALINGQLSPQPKTAQPPISFSGQIGFMPVNPPLIAVTPADPDSQHARASQEVCRHCRDPILAVLIFIPGLVGTDLTFELVKNRLVAETHARSLDK